MLTIDPRVLRRASRDLIRHGLDLDDECQIPMPRTGRSYCVTQEGLERFLAHQASLPADDFEGLSGTAYRDSAGRLHGEAVAGASAQRALAPALVTWELTDGPR